MCVNKSSHVGTNFRDDPAGVGIGRCSSTPQARGATGAPIIALVTQLG